MRTEKIGLREAAEHLGVSKDTVWRAIQRSELNAELDHGPAGAQYWLSKKELDRWWQGRKDRRRRSFLSQASPDSQTQSATAIPVRTPQASQVLQETVAAEATVFAAPTSEVFEVHAAPALVPVEVHLQALRLVERAQLQLERAQFELRSMQNALTEQAESLLEKEALAKQLAALEEENRQNQSLWQAEKASLLASLQERNSRVEWLEKRVPRWIRSVFGAR